MDKWPPWPSLSKAADVPEVVDGIDALGVRGYALGATLAATLTE